VGVLLPAVSALAGIWLLRLALSERVSRYPAPLLGRAAGIGLALAFLATAVSACASIAFRGGLNSEWQLRLLYGATGLVAALMGVAVGLYAIALAPRAYERQHPQHPSEFGTKGTAVMGVIAGVTLIALGLAGAVIAAYLVAVVPGH